MDNEIDLLMDIDPTEMTSEHIDDIIAYMRKQRGFLEKGVKPKKAEGPKKAIDLAALGLSMKKVEPPPSPMKRRSF
jgi:hypothetical protein